MATSRGACATPPSTRISVPDAACPRSRARRTKRETDAIAGSASPLESEARVGRRHPGAVVLDADQRLAAQLDRDRDAPGARVEGVLDQLLHDRGRAFDDLARGNLVRNLRRQLADRHADYR
jgi:hypothetical protein